MQKAISKSIDYYCTVVRWQRTKLVHTIQANPQATVLVWTMKRRRRLQSRRSAFASTSLRIRCWSSKEQNHPSLNQQKHDYNRASPFSYDWRSLGFSNDIDSWLYYLYGNPSHLRPW
jgi:hypothetical protein